MWPTAASARVSPDEASLFNIAHAISGDSGSVSRSPLLSPLTVASHVGPRVGPAHEDAHPSPAALTAARAPPGGHAVHTDPLPRRGGGTGAGPDGRLAPLPGLAVSSSVGSLPRLRSRYGHDGLTRDVWTQLPSGLQLSETYQAKLASGLHRHASALLEEARDLRAQPPRRPRQGPSRQLRPRLPPMADGGDDGAQPQLYVLPAGCKSSPLPRRSCGGSATTLPHAQLHGTLVAEKGGRTGARSGGGSGGGADDATGGAVRWAGAYGVAASPRAREVVAAVAEEEESPCAAADPGVLWPRSTPRA